MRAGRLNVEKCGRKFNSEDEVQEQKILCLIWYTALRVLLNIHGHQTRDPSVIIRLLSVILLILLHQLWHGTEPQHLPLKHGGL